MPVEVAFYADLIEALRQRAGADDKGLSQSVLDRMAERLRNRIASVSTEPRNPESESDSRTDSRSHSFLS